MEDGGCGKIVSKLQGDVAPYSVSSDPGWSSDRLKARAEERMVASEKDTVRCSGRTRERMVVRVKFKQ